MKKFLPFLLALALLLAVTCGCSDAGNTGDDTNQTNTNQTDTDTANTNQTNSPQTDDSPQTDAPPEEPEIVPYGKCGDNLSWELTDDGVLTISGTGTMAYDAQPWAHYAQSITSVVIGNGVTSIGDDAFAGCANLADIAMPDSMMFIGARAFSGCAALTGMELPKSVKTIGDGAFDGCISLADVYFNGDDWAWSKVKVGAGNDCLLNAAITFVIAEGKCGDDLTWKLTDDGVFTISGTGAMTDYGYYDQPWDSYKKNITSVVIEDGATTIGKHAFFYCSNMTSITLPDGVTTIGESAFSNSGLTSVTIPDSVTTIEDYAFLTCTGLTSIEIPDSVTTLGIQAFGYCDGLTSVTIGSGVTAIGWCAFGDCISLTSVTIRNGVTAIVEGAFYGCINLTSVTIPNSVTTIESNVFNSCDALTTVYFGGTQEQWNAIEIGTYNGNLPNAEIVFG